ncbi:glycoside hydrolase family 12 protein [Pseudocercospora fijiensis CIRAD86]|uniref:Glycoside hydrolase family 12 protein n=1 Tax=Pseudocercospora fijiensis (strain CIRAD86) TaxID=383855 RepID=M3ALV0_PSEFD|nr:glycoside hydrolase family 12 protein [Pseudocercospora fijiensis CIRAD86]EME85576.1 glycoside hydrolase family 12 protein [Pseudocercospora fijiensis CIRAD86]
MKFTQALLTAALLASASAIPTASKTVKPRAQNCDQWGSAATGGYKVYNNVWNKRAASSGSQCFSISGLANGVLSWSTTWSWTGGKGQTKSYANAALTSLKPKQISAISSIPSTWSWTNTASGTVVADVAYDLFTSSSASGDKEFEIMVWLAAFGGAGPISSTWGADGSETSIGSTTIGGINFKLYKGPNGKMTVYSFVASRTVNNFNGDLKQFFNYLVSNQKFNKNQYLVSVGAGTEAFEGQGVTFTTTKFSVSVS